MNPQTPECGDACDTLRQQLAGAQAQIETYRLREFACYMALGYAPPVADALPNLIQGLVGLKSRLQDSLDSIERATGFRPGTEPLSTWIERVVKERDRAQRACHLFLCWEKTGNGNLSEIVAQATHALSSDCGSGYVPRAELDKLSAYQALGYSPPVNDALPYLIESMMGLKARLQDSLDSIEKATGFQPGIEPLADWVKRRVDEVDAAEKNAAYWVQQHGVEAAKRGECEHELDEARGNLAAQFDRIERERDTARSELDRCEADRFALGQWLRNAERILTELGYRRCDIPACNCNSYHHV